MTDIVDYMSWNIEHFSKKHLAKELFRKVDSGYWIAALIREMQASMVGVMEVMLSQGPAGAAILTKNLNDIAKAHGTGAKWTHKVSARNVSASHAQAKRADSYAVFWDQGNTKVTNFALAGTLGVAFADREPVMWTTVSVMNAADAANCMLWHAPQPKNHLKATTIADIAKAASKLIANTGEQRMIVSGDFNYDTSKATVYAPLTGIGFAGIFDGELTTLTSLKSFMADETNRKKMVAKGDYDEAFLASAYDNVFLRTLTGADSLKVCVPYVILEELRNNVSFQMVTRSELQQCMEEAKIISDHMPVVLTVSV